MADSGIRADSGSHADAASGAHEPGQQLRGQVALVTGAARRTGRAVAEGLAAAGATVVVHHRASAGEAHQVVVAIEAAGGKASAIAADLSDEAQARQLLATIDEAHGRLEILVNNVGTFRVEDIADVSADKWREAIESNVTTTFIACQAAIPLMARADYGRVVNFADAAADLLRPAPTLAPYMVAKTGVVILTKSLAERYAAAGITVNAISPGIIDNSVTKPPGGEEAIPAGRYATTDDIVNAILFLVRRESGYVTGTNIKVAGGWHA